MSSKGSQIFGGVKKNVCGSAGAYKTRVQNNQGLSLKNGVDIWTFCAVNVQKIRLCIVITLLSADSILGVLNIT